MTLSGTAGRTVRRAVIPVVTLVLMVGCDTGNRSAEAVQNGFRDDVLVPLAQASLQPKVTRRAADTVCDAEGHPSDSEWVLHADVAVAASPSAVAAALREALAVDKPLSDGMYRLQERRSEPIGWSGLLKPDGQAASLVQVSSNVDVRHGLPDDSWSHSC